MTHALGGKHPIETSFWYKELSGEMDHSNSNTYSRVVCVLKMNKMIWPLTMTIVKWKSVSCVQTFFDPMDYTVHGILQARILERVAFPFSTGSSQPRNWTGVKQYYISYVFWFSFSRMCLLPRTHDRKQLTGKIYWVQSGEHKFLIIIIIWINTVWPLIMMVKA